MHRRDIQQNCGVAISDHTRRILWAKASNACARCDAPLVQSPEPGQSRHAVIGEECHIVARSPSGPRGDAGPRDDIDGYANLVLLCANCHALIDAQPKSYPPDELRRMKETHEAKVASGPSAADFRWWVTGRNRDFQLRLVENGDQLVDVVGAAYSFDLRPPSGMSREQRSDVGDFLQSCSDWGEIYSDIGPRGRMDAAQDLDDHLDALREAGLVVYAARRGLTLHAGGRTSPWSEAVVVVIHEAEARRAPEAA